MTAEVTKIAIALDVGGTSVKSGLVEAGGRVIGTPIQTPVDSQADAPTILHTFAAIIHHHRQDVAYEAFCGVGFGFPNPMRYPEGVCLIQGQHKYDALYGVHVGQAIRARLPLGDFPLLFRNDAEAAIVGEAIYGAGRPWRRLIGVTLGTGLGSSFVVDGVRQASGPGVPEEHDGFLWPLLVVGDQRADDVFSIRGLTAYLELAGAQADTIREAAERARQGDAPSQAAFAQFGADLGAFLRPFVEAFGAEAVLSMGGISGALDVFGPALRAALPVPVLASQLGEEAALIGAADLVLPR